MIHLFWRSSTKAFAKVSKSFLPSKKIFIIINPNNKFNYSTFINWKKMENDPKRINGKEIAEQIQKELEVEVKKFKEETKITPGLAVILVGER
jgi:hypothetical protein